MDREVPTGTDTESESDTETILLPGPENADSDKENIESLLSSAPIDGIKTHTASSEPFVWNLGTEINRPRIFGCRETRSGGLFGISCRCWPGGQRPEWHRSIRMGSKSLRRNLPSGAKKGTLGQGFAAEEALAEQKGKG